MPPQYRNKAAGQHQDCQQLFLACQNEAKLKAVAKTGATALAMDMVPRISRAQKMDAYLRWQILPAIVQ